VSSDDVLSAVFPHLREVVVEGVELRGETLRLSAHVGGDEVGCPGCGVVTSRVHSRYVRRLKDVAAGGQAVEIAVTVRRFRCAQSLCDRRTFAEQVPSLAGRYQRRTGALKSALEAISVMLAGRAGARLSERLKIAASRSSLLRLLRAVPEPVSGTLTAVGIDDFALRRGRIYGTVVIDMDTHRPVDVLPERTAAAVADWLKAHPTIEVICRDRAGAYAEGARIGAPNAIQVADRWHLYSNLCHAVEKIVHRHRRDLIEPQDLAEVLAEQHIRDLRLDPSGVPDVRVRPVDRLVERTLERHNSVHALLAEGRNLSGISRELGLDRHTVRRFAQALDVADLIDEHRELASILDGFKTHLHQRWNSGARDAALLHREITAQGYRGSPQTVRRYLQRFRDERDIPPAKPRSPSVREVTGWLTRRPDELADDETTKLAALLARSPVLAATRTLIHGFATMLIHRQGQDLPAWLEQAHDHSAPEMHTFANGLRRDLAAVTAGLTLPYSSGAVEGNVNRIKMIKRQMYGRAGFELLRHRILLRA
jgi:transposase